MATVRTVRTLILLFIYAGGCTSAAQSSPEEQRAALREIAESHIAANVPSESDFDRLLVRDLLKFFAVPEGFEDFQISYQLLRNGPTQTGISYPKFYAWVRLESDKALVREGAARIAAIARERFEIVQFLGIKEIQRDPDQLYRIFPAPLIPAIKEKANPNGKQGTPPNHRMQFAPAAPDRRPLMQALGIKNTR